MESEDEPDKLHIQENPKYELILSTNSEPVMYSNKWYKVNAYGTKQERDLVLTTKHVFNLKNLKVRRKIICCQILKKYLIRLKNSNYWCKSYY